MKTVYICSAYQTNDKIEKNKVKTFLYCRFAYDNGYFPIAPQVYLPYILDYGVKSERIKIFQHCKKAIRACEEMWVFGDIMTIGCNSLIDYAIEQNKVIKYFDRFCEPLEM